MVIALVAGCTSPEYQRTEIQHFIEPALPISVSSPLPLPLRPDSLSAAAFRTIVSLNYITVSISSIASYRDRIVLDQEQDAVINNLDMTMIRDEELLDSYHHLLELLKSETLSDSQRRRMEWKFERKVEDAFYDAIAEGLSGGGSRLFTSGNPWMAAAGVLQQAGGSYFSYRANVRHYQGDLEESLWKLDDDTYAALMTFRIEFMKDCWTLMHKRYGNSIPDAFRLSEKQIDEYLNVLKDDNIGRRFRRLASMQSAFKAYPPFWYYLGADAQHLGRTNDADVCYANFEAIRQPLYRRDDFYSSVCLNRVALRAADLERNRSSVLQDLRAIERYAPDRWEKLAFAAAYYQRLGLHDDAVRLLRPLLDGMEAQHAWVTANAAPDTRSRTTAPRRENMPNPVALTLARGMLADSYTALRDTAATDRLLGEILKSDVGQHRDALYVIGRADDLRKLNELRPEILRIMLMPDTAWYRKDKLTLFVPVKFFYEDLDLDVTPGGRDHLVAELSSGGATAPSGELSFDHARRGLVFVTQYDLKGIEREGVTVTLRHPTCNLKLQYACDRKGGFELQGVTFYGKQYRLVHGKFERMKPAVAPMAQKAK